jgi:hypothetical protein
MQKEREIKEGRMQIKNEKDIERQRMREDMMRKKKEIMMKGGGGSNNVKVEIVGLEFM